MQASDLKKYIPEISNSTSIEEINKGFSSDKKFLVTNKNTKLLLRVSNIKEFQSKLNEYNTLTKLHQYSVRSSKPISIGLQQELEICYMLLSYIDGEDGEEMLPKYSKEEQFKIGLEAGRELKKMHNLAADSSISNWYERKSLKNKKYIEAYKNCGIKIKNEDKIITFIEENEKYLRKRPNTFQHDDFHPANIIVKNKHYAGAIDFNRYDWGDPIHDFYKVALFGRSVSIPFSIGQIKGYFDSENIPEEFWRLYALYAAMSIFSSIIWTIGHDPKGLPAMLENLCLILEDHKYFERLKPQWYD